MQVERNKSCHCTNLSSCRIFYRTNSSCCTHTVQYHTYLVYTKHCRREVDEIWSGTDVNLPAHGRATGTGMPGIMDYWTDGYLPGSKKINENLPWITGQTRGKLTNFRPEKMKQLIIMGTSLAVFIGSETVQVERNKSCHCTNLSSWRIFYRTNSSCYTHTVQYHTYLVYTKHCRREVDEIWSGTDVNLPAHGRATGTGMPGIMDYWTDGYFARWHSKKLN